MENAEELVSQKVYVYIPKDSVMCKQGVPQAFV